MNELIMKWHGIQVMRRYVFYSPAIHSPETIGALLTLDSHYGITKLMSRLSSWVRILMDMEIGKN